jgi:hypothetical protein
MYLHSEETLIFHIVLMTVRNYTFCPADLILTKYDQFLPAPNTKIVKIETYYVFLPMKNVFEDFGENKST